MRKPYKPYITSLHWEAEEASQSKKDEANLREKRGGFSRRGRSSGRKFDKGPTTKIPRVSGRAVDKDNDRCYHCHQPGQFAAKCPEKNKGQSQKPPEGKKFEAYAYAYSGAEELWLATATTILQAYEEAFMAIKNCLKHTDPLHGLNM